MNNETNVFIDGEDLQIENVAQVARKFYKVDIKESAKEKIIKSRAMLESWIEQGKIIYGITTGFGPLVSTLIPTKYQTDLQENLIRSHSANVGPIFGEEEVRAAMLLRLNALSKGFSAIRLDVLELLKEMLNRGVHPIVPEWGSVGASGDLTPSAHIALAIMGEGKVIYKNKIVASSEALKEAGLVPIKFLAKEGLALINGTTMMTGVGALQVNDAWNLIKTAEIISALSIEVLKGSIEPFVLEAHRVKPHPGQLKCVENIKKLLQGSKLVWSSADVIKIQEDLQKQLNDTKEVVDSHIHIQNAYSLRAVPQVLGAVRDALDYITQRVTTEINSANDNPLFFEELGVAYQGAHFHGQSVALPFDVLSIALTEIGIISERRLNRILDPIRSNGLTPFLAGEKAGLRCGFEGAQYIPTSLIAECRTLATPASIQSIPSNGENQDVVSMGLVAARKAREIKTRIEYVLAVELLAACEAAEERGSENLGTVSGAIFKSVREKIARFNTDRKMSDDFETAKNIIHSGLLVEIAENLLGSKL